MNIQDSSGNRYQNISTDLENTSEGLFVNQDGQLSISYDLANKLAFSNISGTAHRLFFLLASDHTINSCFANIPSHQELASKLKVNRQSIGSAMRQLVEEGFLPKRCTHFVKSIESIIRDRLHAQLGGLREVQTAVGRIDLLTESEIIEVKRAEEWKAALGQIKAYGAFYPNHTQRIHLFGPRGEFMSAAMREVCEELGVTVTFEEVAE